MSNHGSRKGVGVDRSEFDVLRAYFRKFGVQIGEHEFQLRGTDTAFRYLGRRKVTALSFETTTLYFDTKGRYLGREYMARDECDYFTPREVR